MRPYAWPGCSSLYGDPIERSHLIICTYVRTVKGEHLTREITSDSCAPRGRAVPSFGAGVVGLYARTMHPPRHKTPGSFVPATSHRIPSCSSGSPRVSTPRKRFFARSAQGMRSRLLVARCRRVCITAAASVASAPRLDASRQGQTLQALGNCKPELCSIRSPNADASPENAERVPMIRVQPVDRIRHAYAPQTHALRLRVRGLPGCLLNSAFQRYHEAAWALDRCPLGHR